MLIVIAAIGLVVVVSSAVALKLLVRTRAPERGWFVEIPRSGNALTILGTMFGVMLAFVIFFALQSYQRARDGAGVEAIAVNEMFSAASIFGGASGEALDGDVACYARAVVADEWPAMREGRSSALVQSWTETLTRDLGAATPEGARQEAAYSQFFDLQTQRREGRRTRLAESNASVPPPLWAALCIGGSLIVAFMCAQADRREGPVIQALPIAFVSAMVSAGMCVVVLLDHPFAQWPGSVAPTEMLRTLAVIEAANPQTPCDSSGVPNSP